MSEWKNLRIKDIAKCIGSGATPKSTNMQYYENGEFSWVNTGDLTNDIVYKCSQCITQAALNDLPNLRFYPKDTIIVAMYGATIGKVGLLNMKSTVNQACCAIVPNCNIINPKFGLYYLLNYKDRLVGSSCGSTQPNVSQDKVQRIPITLPSISDQSRIIDYLDVKTSAIDSRISVLEQKRDAYERLKKSIINDAVTHGLNPNVKTKDSGVEWIGEIPEHWDIVEMKYYCKKIFSGATPSTNEASYWNGDIPWISSGACHDKIITTYTNTITKEGLSHSSTKLVPKGTTLLAMTGATCGNTGYLGFDTCTNQSICAYLENKKVCFSKYLFYMLQGARSYVTMFKTGGVQGGINIQNCSEFKVPKVPYAEQQEIVIHLDDKLSKVDSAVTLLNAQIEKYKLLKRSLINEVITGQRAV